MTPKVTVLMTVYNGERYLKECIESVLNQTFTDFEFLIIDDYSKDGSLGMAKSYNDKRILIIGNEKNLGQVKSLNVGLGLARGGYIARIDQDDMMMSDRLQAQVDFLDKRLDVVVVGTWGNVINEKGKIIERSKFPLRNEEIIGTVLFGGYFLMHPSVMFRKDAIVAAGKYNETFSYAEDYDLWTRLLLKKDKLANIPEFLTKFRYHKESSSRQFSGTQLKNVYKSIRNFARVIAVTFTEHDLDKLCNMLINMGLMENKVWQNEEDIMNLKENIGLVGAVLEKTITYFNFKRAEIYSMKKVFLNRMLNFAYESRSISKTAGKELYLFCLKNCFFILEKPKLYIYSMA